MKWFKKKVSVVHIPEWNKVFAADTNTYVQWTLSRKSAPYDELEMGNLSMRCSLYKKSDRYTPRTFDNSTTFQPSCFSEQTANSDKKKVVLKPITTTCRKGKQVNTCIMLRHCTFSRVNEHGSDALPVPRLNFQNFVNRLDAGGVGNDTSKSRNRVAEQGFGAGET